MLAWLVRDGELGQVVANHLGLDLNLVEGLAVVDSDDAANHLGDDDHIAQVCSHGVGLISASGGLHTEEGKSVNRNHECYPRTSTTNPRSSQSCNLSAAYLLGLPQALNKGERLALEAPLEAAPA